MLRSVIDFSEPHAAFAARRFLTQVLFIAGACATSACSSDDYGKLFTGPPTVNGGAAGVPSVGHAGIPSAGQGGAPSAGQGGASPSVCKPGGGPYWVEEGEALTAPVTCATGLALAKSEFSVSDLPAGATYDSATATLSWTPALDQAAVYSISVRVASGETGVLKIGVADRFDDPANVSVRDPVTYTEEFGLPVMHLQVPPDIDMFGPGENSGDDLPYHAATLVYRGRTYAMEAKYRGHSSLQYPKRNYTLRFDKADKFDEPELAGGFLDRRHVALITPFDDASYVRYRLALTLWNAMDARNVQVKNFGVVLYVNGRFHGLYGASDKIDNNLFQRHGFSEDGNLYMGISHQANFASWLYNEGNPQNESRRKTNLVDGWEKKEGLPDAGMPGAFDDLQALLDFAASSTDEVFTAEAPTRFDMQDYSNWLILTTAIQAFDTFGKNTLHYHDPVADAPWRVVLWDFNESFGQNWRTTRVAGSISVEDLLYQATGGVGYTNRNALWRRLWAHPTFGPALRARYGQLLRAELGLDKVLALFDRMVAEITPVARRDERRWLTEHRDFFDDFRSDDFLDVTGEAAYVRQFIQSRWVDLLSQY